MMMGCESIGKDIRLVKRAHAMSVYVLASWMTVAFVVVAVSPAVLFVHHRVPFSLTCL